MPEAESVWGDRRTMDKALPKTLAVFFHLHRHFRFWLQTDVPAITRQRLLSYA